LTRQLTMALAENSLPAVAQDEALAVKSPPAAHRPLLASPRPQSKVTSHALTARGSNDSKLVLIEKDLEGNMIEF
jgi:hypothetical protein